MLLLNPRDICNKLLAVRKSYAMTQMEVVDAAGLSCRTYADTECATVDMRGKAVLRIHRRCTLPLDEIVPHTDAHITIREQESIERLEACSQKNRETVLRLASVFLQLLTD